STGVVAGPGLRRTRRARGPARGSADCPAPTPWLIPASWLRASSWATITPISDRRPRPAGRTAVAATPGRHLAVPPIGHEYGQGRPGSPCRPRPARARRGRPEADQSPARVSRRGDITPTSDDRARPAERS